MPGPPPKPEAHRRRRNATAGVARLSADGRQGPAPAPKTEVELCAVAMEYWETLWASPMALVYTDADVFPLTRLVRLIHDREAGSAAWNADGEIRQLEDRFGISPLARRRLSWEIGQAAGAADPAPAPVRGVPAAERLRRLGPDALRIA